MVDERVFHSLDERHLTQIETVANVELRRFLENAGHPPGKYETYRQRLLAICLVQGTAQHFTDLQPDLKQDREVSVDHNEIAEKGYRIEADGRVISGVKDIDVFFFFEEDPATPIPHIGNARKSVIADFSNFGQRRLDLMKKALSGNWFRSANLSKEHGPVDVIRWYLETRPTGTAHWLAQKSVVGIAPSSIFAHPIWVVRRSQKHDQFVS